MELWQEIQEIRLNILNTKGHLESAYKKLLIIEKRLEPKECYEPLLCKKCNTITNHLWINKKYECQRCQRLGEKNE